MNYYAVFPQWTRLVMFYTFISLALLVLGYYVLLPLFHYRDIGKKLSLEDAARIAGLHFGEKSYDYLLSYLQLYFQHTWSGSEELRKAGLIQKKFFLEKIPIPLAVQWKEILPVVRKYFPIIILMLLCWILWPHIIQTGSRRWIEYDKPARDLFPFKINPDPNSLIALSSSQHTIWVSVSGNSIPGELNIQLEGNEFQMQKKDERNFYYVIPNIHKNVNFSIRAGSYESEVFTVEVVRKPWWESWVTEIEYPAYLNRKKDIFSNQGDLTVPAGSRIKWLLKPRNSGKAGMIFQDSVLYFSDNHLHSPSFTLMKSTSYALFLQPDHPSFSQTDSARFHIQVIPDQYPEIQCTFSHPDSTNPLVLRINGHLKDDYGFSRFYLSGTLNYTDSSGKTVRQTTLIPLPLDKQNTYFPFETEFDFASLLPSPGAKLDLYLEVFDNDGVQGPKSSRSMPYIVKKPDKEEMQQLQKENQQTIHEKLQESLTKSKDLQKQINDLISKLRDKKTPDYEDRKKLEDLLKKQNELKNNIEKLKELQQKNTQLQQELNPEEIGRAHV